MGEKNEMEQRCTHGVESDRMAALFVGCLLVHAKRHQVRFPLLVPENKDFNASPCFLVFFSISGLNLVSDVLSVS